MGEPEQVRAPFRLAWEAKVAWRAALLLGFALGTFLVVEQSRVRSVTEARLEEDLLRQAEILAHALPPTELSGQRLRERMRALATHIDARVTVVAEDGAVLADSEAADPSALENHRHREEVLEARRTGRALLRRFSRPAQRELVYAAGRVPGTGAVVLVARDVQAVQEALEQPTETFWWVAAGVVGAGVLGAILIARGIGRSVRDLTGAVEAVEAGGLDAVAFPRGEGDVGRLGEAFRRMTERLRTALGRAEGEAARLSTILE
ncbi:MAG: HAMP domain-containing protein, partial [Planctomycetota bacterium]